MRSVVHSSCAMSLSLKGLRINYPFYDCASCCHLHPGNPYRQVMSILNIHCSTWMCTSSLAEPRELLSVPRCGRTWNPPVNCFQFGISSNLPNFENNDDIDFSYHTSSSIIKLCRWPGFYISTSVRTLG